MNAGGGKRNSDRSRCLGGLGQLSWRGWPSLGLALMLAGLIGLAPSAHAARRALLVGVSELASQSSALWLQAPHNDVVALRSALLDQGFRNENITVLADGVEGASTPDSANIQAELARLAEISQAGDTLLLYFSGHGMRARPGVKDYQEPDRLAEVFLARDALGAIPGTVADTGNIGGILRDDQLGVHVQNLLARGAFVLAIFDTCAAASMTRGSSTDRLDAEHADIRWRGLRPTQLAPAPAQTRSRPGKATAGSTPEQPQAQAAHAQAASRARYVALYASESHQLTPEMRLPRGNRHGTIHGLLTWSLLQALGNRPQTYREWFNIALQNYTPVLGELERLYPTRELPSPVAEGALDTALWSNPETPMTSQPVWPAYLTSNRLNIRLGQLDGLEARHAVLVTALQSDGQRATAVGRLEQVDLQHASLTVPAALKKIVNPIWSVSPLDTPENPAAHALRVHSASPLPPGISLDFPLGIRSGDDASAEVRIVNANDPAATPGAPATYRLEALPGLARPLANWLEKDTQNTQNTPLDAATLRQRLHGLAQFKWWHRLATLCAGMQMPGFEARLEEDKSGKNRRSLLIRNRRPQSLDVVIASLTDDGRTELLYPTETDESNRFEAANGARPSEKTFLLPESHPESRAGSRAESRRQLLIVASPAKSRTPPRFFGITVPPPEDSIRLRGAAIETASEAYCTLQSY